MTLSQSPQGDPDVLIFPLDPQIATPATLRSEKCLPGPTEVVQNEISLLAERPDQLVCQCQREHCRMVQALLVATDVGDDYVRDSGDAVTVAERFNARVPGGLLAEPIRSKLDRPVEARMV